MSEMNGRGRPQAVTVEEVWEYLSDERWHTTSEIAEEFSVTRPTIRSKVKILRETGNIIIIGVGGIRLLDDTNVTEQDADDWKNTGIWLGGTLAGLANIAKPMNKKGLLKEIRKSLPADRNTRRLIRAASVRLTRLIDAAFIEEDEEE